MKKQELANTSKGKLLINLFRIYSIGNLVENAEDYLYSSVRIWHRRRLDNEPLEVDADKIEWREA